MDWPEQVLLVAGLLSALEGLGILRRWLVARWQATFGRRRRAERTVARFGVGCHLSYFEGLLGPPPFRHGDGDIRELIWVDDLFYVHAVCVKEVVVQWVLTTRSAKFRPTFQLEPHGSDRTQVRLLVTRYSQIGEPSNGTVNAQVGARRAGYWEAHYRGNPGHYCTFIAAWNDAGAGGGVPIFADMTGGDPVYGADEPAVAAYRSEVAPNSFGVAVQGPVVAEWVGADADLVRLLP